MTMSNKEWEAVKAFGYIEIKENYLKLYYTQFSFVLYYINDMPITESAVWQGDRIICRGKGSAGEDRIMSFSNTERLRLK